MFSVLRGLAIKQKSNLASVCLVILLVVALTFSFLVKFSSDVEAQQQNLEIINLAQSPVNGDWQTEAFDTNYTLWKFRSPAAYPGNRYLKENHYTDPGPPEVPKCDNVYQHYVNRRSYEDNRLQNAFSGISAIDCAGNTTTSGFTWPLNKETVRTQKPFLVVGNAAQNSSGFINKEIVLKLWILQDKDIENLMLNIEDFCDTTNWDLGSQYGETVLYIKGQSGEQRIKDETSCDSVTHIPIKKSIVGEDFGSARYVQLQSGGVEEMLYKQYRVVIRIENTHVNNNTYVNQFRLNVQQPAFSYLGAGQTARNGSGEYKTDSALSISNRLPGGEQDEDGRGTYKRLEILWRTTIYLASDPSRGCSGYEKQPIGLYDSDYPTSFYNDNDDYESKLKPMVQVWSVDRNDFLENLSVNFEREEGKDIEFDGDQGGSNVSNNQWEYEEIRFERDRIYKLEIYNIDERSWIQIGLPYDQLNALSKCVYKPLVKAYYSDVSIGGRFGLGTHYDACEDQRDQPPPIEANLYTHDHRSNVADSSSAQYAVRVNDEIIGFYSNYDPNTRKLRKDNPLTFANTGNAVRGGHFNDDGRCIPNYWRGADSSLQPIGEDYIKMADASSGISPQCIFKDIAQNGIYLYQPVSSLLTLENGCDQPPVALKLRATIYVDGDLLIKSDIINSTPQTQWNAFNEIGYIYLIVKGDILIDPKVRQIDAILVAMPDETKVDKLGRIYTCYVEDLFDSSFNIHSFEEILVKTEAELNEQNRKYNNQCQNQLVINGALIGREVHLGRTYNFADRHIHVAETINLLPEYFVGTPQLPEFNEWFYKSDSVIVLPTNF